MSRGPTILTFPPAPPQGLDPFAVPLTGTILIEASAGTGKTHTITVLYARLLLEVGLTVDQILVVTYTNAATAELRARIRRRLHALLAAFDGEPIDDDDLARLVAERCESGHGKDDRARLLTALHGFDQSCIFTIHGFCQRMLQEHAFESGVSFDLELITDERALRTQIVQDFWVRELYAATPELVAAVHRVKKPKPIERLERLADLVSTHPNLEIVSPPNLPATDLESGWVGLQLRCAEYVRRELRRRKEVARQQSFDDLLQRLAEALRGSEGTRVAERIRKRLRAALIDEFQDTDPIQYEIFRRIYHAAADTALFLIGDPKQAIYAFRGAEVFAYLDAKRDAAQVHTLITNWRSGPSLVRAINALFRHQAPFVLADIPFVPAHAAPTATDQLNGTAAGTAPFEILFVRRWGQQGKSGVLTKDWANQQLAALTASEIVRFVNSGALIGDRRVAFADVAVLCRTNDQASNMQTALRTFGIPSVLQTEASIFDTSEATEVGRVLAAMAEPSDAAAVRAALATTLLGQTAADLYQLQDDERAWDEWLQHFQDWNATWLKRGFVAAFRRMLERQEVIPRLLELVDGERRLTNVLHLMELLHSTGTEERFGPTALTHWLAQMRQDKEVRAAWVGESAQIRLESDDAAVKLVTIHKSKGLQYPIVYCPYLWDGALLHRNDKQTPRFHDSKDDFRLKLDLGSDDFSKHLKLAEREALAENLRILYVALTRAQHRCSVVWGAFGSAPETALGYLLHRESPNPSSPQALKPEQDAAAAAARRIKRFISEVDDDGMRADLERLASEANGSIVVRDLPREVIQPVSVGEAEGMELACRTAQRRVGLAWRVASFSSLIRTATPLSEPAQEGIDHDGSTEVAAVVADASEQVISLHDLPAGTRTGQMLHGILEQLDFSTATPELVRQQVIKALGQTRLEAKWVEPLVTALADVLDTPLSTGGIRLRHIALHRRLNELEFVFPVALGARQQSRSTSQLALWQGEVRATPFTAKRLATVFATHAPPALRAYANRLAQLDFTTLAGFLKGFVDLIFEHDGRWYVVDYKSNRLGPTPDAYADRRLAPVMQAHHYVLQYHLYVVALHRYLQQRLRGYDYERHFGSVYYLFLRGMAPSYSVGNGVFADRPSRRLIEALSATLAG